ncbi:MAG: thioredoxin [Acidimicrobiales bacterium]|jgi:thioredoxin 1|nr:thioredoxin [Actinomycetota bacterium]MCH1514223.1 thioredoxin [Acidimicrobiales bacterium]HAQ03715.1 thioredoxin [Acidimicrobiaceae bacterium]|tara:strand:+ start:42 stop:368 length:327 start_codon:yes stop_codon:yes gene_type:complete
MSASIINLSAENFESEISSADQPILIDFWAEWCGPCKMIAPILEEIATEQEGVIKIAKVDVDSAPELAQKFEIMSIPTLIVFNDGEPAKRLVGAQGKHQLLEALSEFI